MSASMLAAAASIRSSVARPTDAARQAIVSASARLAPAAAGPGCGSSAAGIGSAWPGPAPTVAAVAGPAAAVSACAAARSAVAVDASCRKLMTASLASAPRSGGSGRGCLDRRRLPLRGRRGASPESTATGRGPLSGWMTWACGRAEPWSPPVPGVSLFAAQVMIFSPCCLSVFLLVTLRYSRCREERKMPRLGQSFYPGQPAGSCLICGRRGGFVPSGQRPGLLPFGPG